MFESNSQRVHEYLFLNKQICFATTFMAFMEEILTSWICEHSYTV